jgi:hypothetical protein
LIEGCARVAQDVRFFAPLSLSETLAPLPLLQGIAWIDQSAVSIVGLRSDLLAPRSEINIQRQTAKIVFGPVKIASLESVLWEPQAASLEMETGGQLFHEEHRYSKYRLFHAKSRVVTSLNWSAAFRASFIFRQSAKMQIVLTLCWGEILFRTRSRTCDS